MTYFPLFCFLYILGTAIRHCSDEKGWLSPELFNCTTVTFSHLKKLVIMRENKTFILWFSAEHLPQSWQFLRSNLNWRTTRSLICWDACTVCEPLPKPLMETINHNHAKNKAVFVSSEMFSSTKTNYFSWFFFIPQELAWLCNSNNSALVLFK